MAQAFFSQSWYRVGHLKPALAPHVRVHRHVYGGNGWYVLEDDVTGKAHRLSPAAYAVAGRLDGCRTVDEIWLEVARLLDEEAPTQDETVQLLGQLHGADLLAPGTAADVAELAERQSRQARQLFRQNLLNPMSIRVRLFDPDRLLIAIEPLFRPLIGPLGFVLWLAFVGFGLVLAGRHWNELTQNLSDRVLSVDNALVLALVYPVVKAAHELGHGLVVKRFGGAVHEIGLMFLIFFPVPYVDASASAAFPSKWRRAAVAAAGIIVETTLATLALLVWQASEPGMLRAVAFNVMLIGGISTVLVNGNPLIRFDGYYVLSDLIEIPNLGQRANRYLGHLCETRLFGAPAVRPFAATAFEKVVFLAYAPVAWVYRVLLSISIGVFVASSYFVAGVSIALWMSWQSLVFPILKALKHALTAPLLRRYRARVVTVLGAAALGLGLALFRLPAPSWGLGEGVVLLPDEAAVRTRTSGFLTRLEVPVGARVERDGPVAQLDDPAIDARLASLEWRARELEFKLAANVVNDRVLAQTTRIALDDAHEQLIREQDRRRHLEVRSPAAGRFEVAMPPEDLTGRYLREGEILGHILPDRADRVRVAIEQSAIDQVRTDLVGVELVVVGTDGRAIPSRILRAVPAGQYDLPHAALSRAGGGPIATDPRDGKNLTALARVFQFDVALPEEVGAIPFNTRVLVKFHYGPEPFGWQLYRHLRQAFLARFDA